MIWYGAAAVAFGVWSLATYWHCRRVELRHVRVTAECMRSCHIRDQTVGQFDVCKTCAGLM